ncbi:MAG: orotidine-5'-phosphate decarboxylase, partial [Desulfobacula sp.]|nr:orotidine-5'-phosphate decarboxylase [Desulfobacula sp.]
EYVKLLDGKVGVFKIGLELFIDQGPSVVKAVKNLSSARIFLDLKLHDISTTVQRAMERVVDLGVDFITVHGSSSKAMLEKAVKGGQGKTQILGVTLLTDNNTDTLKMSGFKDKFVKEPHLLVMERAKMVFDSGCQGVICSGKEVEEIKKKFGQAFLAVTPGIRPAWSVLENDDQKRITTPGQAIGLGSDLIVIGRPIRDAFEPAMAAQKVIDEIEASLI